MADVEVELVLQGSVDLYLSDSAAELLMSDRMIEPTTKEPLYPSHRALKMWVELGLRNSPALTDEGKEIYGIELDSGKIVGFFSGNQDFIGLEFVRATSKKSIKIPKPILTKILSIKVTAKWRPRP